MLCNNSKKSTQFTTTVCSENANKVLSNLCLVNILCCLRHKFDNTFLLLFGIFDIVKLSVACLILNKLIPYLLTYLARFVINLLCQRRLMVTRCAGMRDGRLHGSRTLVSATRPSLVTSSTMLPSGVLQWLRDACSSSPSSSSPQLTFSLQVHSWFQVNTKMLKKRWRDEL